MSNYYISAGDGFKPRTVNRLKHGFAGHPLFEIDALRQLAKRLETSGRGQVKFLRSGIDETSPLALMTRSQDGSSIDDVFDHLDRPGAWIALFSVQTDEQYLGFINEVIASAHALVRDVDPGIFDQDAYIFISSAPSLTPIHIDRENNFWLQMRGRKRLTVWDPNDREVVSQVMLENKIVHNTDSGIPYSKQFEPNALIDETIEAGEGVFFPSTSPHMTRTEAPGQLSISVGVVYYSSGTRRAAYVHAFNALARKFRLHPAQPGGNEIVDTTKWLLGWVVINLATFLGRYTKPRGF